MDYTFNGGHRFPNGTTVKVFRKSDIGQGKFPLTADPSGVTAIDTAAVSGGTVTFNDIVAGERYVVTATVNDEYRVEEFMASVSEEDRLEVLEEAADLLPAASGGDDLDAINDAITAVADAGGGRVQGRPGSTYKISGPIILKSEVTLDMTDCTIQFTATSVKTNMLQNAAVTAAATATDAATTNNSAVVTTGLADQASVGQSLAVVAAGAAGGDGGGPLWLYGTIASLDTGANTITYSQTTNVNGVKAASTGSARTAYLFNRDTDITVIGGTWDSGSNWNAGADRIAAGFNSHLLRFRRVDGLVVRDVTLKSGTFTANLGWAFGINPADCTDFTVQDCRGQGVSAVVQGDGPLKRGHISNIRGTTQDDMVAFGCVDFQGNDTEGDISDILIEGVQANGAYRAVALFAGTGAGGMRYCRATVRSVKGSTTQSPVRVVDYTGAGAGPIEALIEDVTATPGAGLQGVQVTATYPRLARSSGIDFAPPDAGLLLSSIDPALAAGGILLGGGVIYLTRIKAFEPVKATNLRCRVTVAGATLTAGQNLAGVYDMNGLLVAKTADLSGSWNSTGFKSHALTAESGRTLDLQGGPGIYYWAALLSVGTTKPTFAAQASGSDIADVGNSVGLVNASKIRAGYESVGSRTSLVSLASLSINYGSMNSIPWVGIS